MLLPHSSIASTSQDAAMVNPAGDRAHTQATGGVVTLQASKVRKVPAVAVPAGAHTAWPAYAAWPV